MTKMVLAEGGFGPNLRRGRLPKLVARCIAERYADGHWIRFPDGLPKTNKWSAPNCWVHYESGRFAFDDSVPDLTGPPERVEIPRAV